MRKSISVTELIVLAILAVAGCTKSNSPSSDAALDPSYLLQEKPADAQGVVSARERTQKDDEVAVEGRIGGSEKPFVEGVAAFTIVDSQLEWCGKDEGCPTPWDYCCADTKGKMATVKIVGDDGQVLLKDARGLLGVKELSKVVVQGKASHDDQGNLIVLAKKVHVAKD